MLRYGSVCSGIESASVAWEPLGMSAAWFSEIEPFPCSVLAHHWPHVTNFGDMTQLPSLMRMGLMEAPDVLVGGTPCQAFSVAGKRDSLDDERGQLTLTYVDLLNAIDEQRVGNECIAVWENVPGVLNTKDNAFGCFLGELSGSGCELQPSGKRWGNAGCVFGPQRAVAWRIIDAQYFGVAQRRRRVFVVASARDGFDPTKILFESEGVQRDIAPSRKARKEVAGFTASSFSQYSEGVGSLRASGGDLGGGSETLVAGQPYQDVSHCLNAGGMGRQDYETESFVVHGIPGNWIGRKPENGGNAVEPMNNISPCLTVTDRHAVAYGVMTQYGSELAGTLTARHDSSPCHDRGQNMVAYKSAVAYVLPINTMTVQGRPSDDLNPRMGSGIGHPSDPQNTLTKAHMHGVFDSKTMGVRRLTPVECERLQGFPDGHTNVPHNGKPAADGPRYKAIGNSKAVPCIQWIGARLVTYQMGLL